MLIEFCPNGLFVAIDGVKLPHIVGIFEKVNDGTSGQISPRRLLRTLDGSLLERIDRGLYVIDGTRRLMRSDDPACI
jgi:hypothetical protein